MKILSIEDEEDTCIIHYELTPQENIMLTELSEQTGKTQEELIQEGFINSVDNFKEKKK